MNHSLIFANLVILLAFYIRSLTGFGSALVSMPFLVQLYPLKFILPVESVIEVLFSVLLIPKTYHDVDRANLLRLACGTLVGSLIGIQILQSFADDTLKRVLGIFIVLFAFNLLRKNDNATPISTKWGPIAGVAGGILGGLFGTSGPAYVIYLSHQIHDKIVIRATLIALFGIDYGWRLIVFGSQGFLSREGIQLALFLAPVCIVGTFLGHRGFLRLNERIYRRLIVALLVFSGVLCLI